MRDLTSPRARSPLDRVLSQALGKVFPAAVVHVRRGGEVVYDRAVGWFDPTTRLRPARTDTLFDLASLTKLFTTTAFLTLVAEGRVALDDRVATVLPDFRGPRPIGPYEDPLHPGQMITISREGGEVDAGAVTFRHLLTHSSGLPAWRPLYRHRRGDLRTVVFTTPFAYPTGTRVLYSDLGFILLGWAVEALTGLRLDHALARRVLGPLGLFEVRFGPVPAPRAAPTERCPWRRRRLWGEVHDENAWAMGGISGHAGLFGTAAAVARLGQAWLNALKGRRDRDCDQRRNRDWGAAEESTGSQIPNPKSEIRNPNSELQGGIPVPGLLPSSLAEEAVCVQAEDGPLRRGLGWALWSPDPTSPGHPLGRRAFGHTGFTGTSLFVDPDRDLVVVALTNRVYYGRNRTGIQEFRVRLHRAL